MGFYLCIFFDNGKVVTVRSIREPDHDAACSAAEKLIESQPDCTDVEVWTRGKKVGSYQRFATAEPEAPRRKLET